MSCWVVPAVAAELWGIPVEVVIDKARTGQIPSKMDLCFLLVDIAPGFSRGTGNPPPATAEPRPLTYVDAPQSAPEPEEAPFDWQTKRAEVAKTRRPPPHLAA